MENLDYWRLCDELSVYQAALLIAGCDPSAVEAYAESWDVHNRPTGYEAAKAALVHAILGGRLRATIRRVAHESGFIEDPGNDWHMSRAVGFHADDDDAWIRVVEANVQAFGVIYRPDPNWDLTTVTVDALREWLAARGFKSGFFFPQAGDAPDYLDPQHARYAPKLAAAVRAWLAVDDPKGKTPKQALAKWLREHGADFELLDEEGKPNEQGIEDCAKVANWQPGGGAPKTPGG